jgi:hypothetical protein
MASLASGLFKSLPKPKYTGEEEELPKHAQPRGPRVVGADQLDETQVVLRVSPHWVYVDFMIEADLDFVFYRKLALRPTETAQDGDHELPRILATAARSQKF